MSEFAYLSSEFGDRDGGCDEQHCSRSVDEYQVQGEKLIVTAMVESRVSFTYFIYEKTDILAMTLRCSSMC